MDKLVQLADHLETIPDKAFDFSQIRNECGTVGCALGHAVTLFNIPHEIAEKVAGACFWRFDGNMPGVWAEQFFNITYEECNWLFYPALYNQTTPWKTTALTRQASRREVIDNIRAFIRHKETI